MLPAAQAEQDEDNPFDVGDDWAELEPGAADAVGLDEDLDWGEDASSEAGGILQSVTTEDARSHRTAQLEGGIASRSSGGGSCCPDEKAAQAALSEGIAALVPPGSLALEPAPVTEGAAAKQEEQGPAGQLPASEEVPQTKPMTAPAASQSQEDTSLKAAEAPIAPAPPPVSKEAGRVVEAPTVPEIEPEAEGDSQQEEEQQGEDTATAGKGWGWGGFKALGQIGKLAAEAARDVKALTGSLQQALAAVEDGSSDEDDSQQPPQLVPVEQSKGAADTGAQRFTRSAQQQPEPSAAPPAQQAIDRNEQGSGDDNDDQDFVDKEMDELTTGAVKAFSSLWGGISGVASKTVTLVSKVEAATVGMAKELVSSTGVSQDVAHLQAVAASSVRGVARNVTRIGTRIEAGLETVGRTAMELLEEVTGQHSGSHMSEGEAERELPGGGVRSFEDLLELYGGSQLNDELENLGNECARIANRARSKLEAGQQAELDSQLAVLGPLFSTLLPSNSSGGAGGGAAAGQQASLLEGITAAAAQEQLAQRYVPIRFLCQDSISRANAFQALLVGAVQGLRNTPAAPATTTTTTTTTPATATADAATASKSPKAPGTAAVAGVGDTGSPHPDDTWDVELDEAQAAAGVGGEQQAQDGPAAVRDIVYQLQAYADKRLAELVAAQLQLLLDHGVNLASPARSVEVQGGSSITWPDNAAQQAALLQQQAGQMAGDVQAVSSTFYNTLVAAVKELPPSESATGVTTSSPAPPKAEPAAADAPDAVEQVAGGGQQKGDANAQDGLAVQGDEVGEQEAFNIDQLQEVCQRAMAQLQSAKQGALSHLEGGLRSLLYPVLVRALVQHIAGPAPSVTPPIP